MVCKLNVCSIIRSLCNMRVLGNVICARYFSAVYIYIYIEGTNSLK